MTLSVLAGHCLSQAFSSTIFRICGTSNGPSASAELIVNHVTYDVSLLSLEVVVLQKTNSQLQSSACCAPMTGSAKIAFCTD